MDVITPYITAGCPVVAVETVEEERFTTYLCDQYLGRADYPQRMILSVAATGGTINVGIKPHPKPHDGQMTYPKAFEFTATRPDTMLIVHDWQHIIRNPAAYRSLKTAMPGLKKNGSIIILMAPSWQMPEELRHDVRVLRIPLPSRSELSSALNVAMKAPNLPEGDYKKLAEEVEPQRERLLDAAAGLALQEAEDAFCLSYVATGKHDPARVAEEKMSQIRQTGLMEIQKPMPVDAIGGLKGAFDYVYNRVLPVRHDPILRVRGIFLVGVQGCGKSLFFKIFAGLYGAPALSIDMGTLMGSLVGQSEGNLNTVLRQAEAVAPCVILLDEIEKGIGGVASSSHTDGGTTSRMVGRLLNWLQEHTSDIVVIATCNDHTKVPPEFMRTGRFDERFFVDLPSGTERWEIAQVHMRKFECKANDELLQTIVSVSDGWSGAEIEGMLKDAAAVSGRKITPDLVKDISQDVKPLSKVRQKEIDDLRQWAHGTLRLANTPDVYDPKLPSRKMAKR